MAKKVWLSFPLVTTTDLNDATVVGFLKGGQKKTLEVEAAVFVTQWLMDKGVPFGIDFETATVDRNVVMEALPEPLQKLLGHHAAAPDETALALGGIVPRAAEPPTSTEPAPVDIPPAPNLEELGAVEIQVVEPATSTERAPVEIPAAETTTHEAVPMDPPAVDQAALMEAVPVETQAVVPTTSAESAAPVSGERLASERPEAESKRASRLRLKRSK